MKLAKLEELRQAAYEHLGRAHNVTFELTDAILLTRNAYSLAVSFSSWRGWSAPVHSSRP